MPHKTCTSFFLHHNCLIRVAIVIGSLWIYKTFKAGFDEILRTIQVEDREFFFLIRKNRVYVFDIRFICVQSVMYLKLAGL